MMVICIWCAQFCDFTIWRHIHVSKPTFWRSLLTQYAYSSTRTLLTLCVITLNINYQCSKLGYWRKNTQRYDTAVHNCKNIGLCVKTGEWNTLITTSERCTVQLQNQATLMSRWIRAVEHRCAVGLAGAHPGLQDRILLNYARIENAHKLRKKTSVSCYV